MLVQIVSIFWRSCFSRSKSGGRQEASGKRSLFGVEAGTLADIRAAALMTFVNSAKGPLWRKTEYQTGRPYNNFGMMAPMKIVAK